MTPSGLHLAAAIVAASITTATWAQTPDVAEQVNVLRYSPAPVTKLALASANMRVGVSLERLTLISGEGNMDKKVTAGLLAGAATLLGARQGTNLARGIDFAEREPIAEHLDKADAERINTEAMAVLMAKLKDAGLDVAGPEPVVGAPFYAGVRGESAVTTDHLAQDGGLFKKSYFYGFYRTPVIGLKYRDRATLMAGFSDDDWFTQARDAAKANATIEFNVSFFNDKKVFGLFDMSMRVFGPLQGGSVDRPILLEVLKNVDDFNVPSGGKDAYVYWTAFKPRFESVAAVMAERLAKALPASQK